jgi:polyhydroxyalkanoate synthesis repressor PhaR
MVIVKKYGNRRLYDTEDSKYVTLAEIAAKIRGGAGVRVLDAKTHEDLTAELLTQIIFEDRDTARLLPVPLLLQLVRMGDDGLAEFFGRYVSWAMDAYLQARQQLAALPRQGLPGFANAAFGAMNPFAAFLGGPARPEPAWPGAASSSASPTAADELAALRREVDELKKTLRKPSR